MRTHDNWIKTVKDFTHAIIIIFSKVNVQDRTQSPIVETMTSFVKVFLLTAGDLIYMRRAG